MPERVARALLSVSDKTGLDRVCRAVLRAWALRSCRPAAPRGRSRRQGFPWSRSATTPAFPRCSTGASRRCTRRCTAASWRGATSPAHMAALERHAHPDDRPRRRQSLSVPRDGREARTARSRTRSRTSTSAGPRWCARRRRTGATSAWSSTPPTTRRSLAELEERRTSHCLRPRASRSRRRRSRTRPPTTARSRTG